MPKQTVTNTTTASTVPAVAKKATKKVEEVAAAAPVAAVESVKKVSKKAEAKAAEVVAPVVTAPVVANTETSSESSTTWQDELKVVQNGLESLISNARTLLASTKRLQKQAEREIKDARKKSKKNKTEGDASNRKASIFKTPVPISAELASFLGKTEKDAMECRATVTKAITAYARKNNLSNKQKINADAKLRKLLRLADGEELTIFNLQNKLKHHYISNKA